MASSEPLEKNEDSNKSAVGEETLLKSKSKENALENSCDNDAVKVNGDAQMGEKKEDSNAFLGYESDEDEASTNVCISKEESKQSITEEGNVSEGEGNGSEGEGNGSEGEGNVSEGEKEGEINTEETTTKGQNDRERETSDDKKETDVESENLTEIKEEIDSDNETDNTDREPLENILNKLNPVVIAGSPVKKATEEGGVQSLACIKLPVKRKLDSDGEEPFKKKKTSRASSSDNRSRKSSSRNSTGGSSASSRSSSRCDRNSRGSSIDMTDKKLHKPFEYGFRREIVYRSKEVNGQKIGDVYYYAGDVKAKKMRSVREVIAYLKSKRITDLGGEHFSFKSVPLGLSDSDKEWCRTAASTRTSTPSSMAKGRSPGAGSSTAKKKRVKSRTKRRKESDDDDDYGLDKSYEPTDDDDVSISALHESILKSYSETDATPSSILSDLPDEGASSSGDDIQFLKEETTTSKKQRRKTSLRVVAPKKPRARPDPQVKVKGLVDKVINRLVNPSKLDWWGDPITTDSSESEIEEFSKVVPRRHAKRKRRRSYSTSSESEASFRRTRKRDLPQVTTPSHVEGNSWLFNSCNKEETRNPWENATVNSGVVSDNCRYKEKTYVPGHMELQMPFLGSISRCVWSKFESDRLAAVSNKHIDSECKLSLKKQTDHCSQENLLQDTLIRGNVMAIKAPSVELMKQGDTDSLSKSLEAASYKKDWTLPKVSKEQVSVVLPQIEGKSTQDMGATKALQIKLKRVDPLVVKYSRRTLWVGLERIDSL